MSELVKWLQTLNSGPEQWAGVYMHKHAYAHIHQYCYNGSVALVNLELEFSVFRDCCRTDIWTGLFSVWEKVGFVFSINNSNVCTMLLAVFSYTCYYLNGILMADHTVMARVRVNSCV